METKGEFKNVTLYTRGAFGVKRTECRTLSYVVRPYAQYSSAVVVEYVEKGKRKPASLALTRDAWGLVVDGLGHPTLENTFESTGDGGATTRYSCFDPRWVTEFEAAWAAYVAAPSTVKVLCDFRGHDPHVVSTVACAAVG